LAFKWLLFPGLNVGTRKRQRFSRHFRSGNLSTLDAGCGNGAFSYHASSLGNRVLGINFDPEQIARCEEFRDLLKIEPERCQFKLHNIYDVLALGQRFDQIICFETLEHLKRDAEVIRLFRAILNPNGLLHLCTPRRDRKSYYGEVLSETEDGGHVRLGYELGDLEAMLAAEGFAVSSTDKAIGLFSLRVEEILNWFESKALRNFPAEWRDALQAVVFLCLYPITFLDAFSSTRLCLYVQAISS